MHQVPPIERYERIKGFAKLCHKAVNHSHTHLKFPALTAEEKKSLGGVFMKSITSSVKPCTSTSTLADDNKKTETGTMTQDTTNYQASQYMKFTFRNVAATQSLHASAPFIVRFSTSSVSCASVAFQPAMQRPKSCNHLSF